MRKVTTSRCVLRGRHLRRRNFGAVPCARSLVGPATQFRFRQTAQSNFSQGDFSPEPIDAFRDAVHFVIRGFGTDLRGEPFGQTRLNDKDVLQHMKNLKDDAKKFRPSFNSALAKSTIRKTTQEKDAKTLAQNFKKQTNSMYEAFKKAPRPNRTCRIASTRRGRSIKS
jgi:hypothetical protein